MIKFADRVKETASVTGGSVYTLAGSVAGHRGFLDALGNGAKCYYCAEFGASWEVGTGTIVSGTMTREFIHASSSGGAALVWPDASIVHIYCVAAATAFQTNTSKGISITTAGTLQAMSGLSRWYPSATMRFTSWEAWVGEAPVGGPVQFTLRKNGVVATTGIITAGTQRMALADLSLAMTTSDYLTLDVTSVGSSTKGSDLVVRLVP